MAFQKVLVIGSKGFIGTVLSQYLGTKHKVYEVDILPDKKNNYFQIDKINPNFNEIFEKNAIDICINASGSANVSLSLENPLNDFNANLYNVEKILEAIRLSKQNARFINLSSAAVYGNPKNLPIKESALINPISPYGYHKYMAEKICEMYSNIYGIKCYNLRLFSVYGIGQKKLVIWDILNKFLTESKVCLFGTGAETRDFINVVDVVKIIELFILDNSIDVGCYNVGNGIQTSIKTVAYNIKNILNSQKEIIFEGNNRAGDPVNWEADIKKILQLGYKQTCNFEDDLHEFVEWSKNLKTYD
ncbi:NAD-dependent epimerase/dehydratase family protein [Treponema pectinovorum]|uniref:NAD-dependent epimerase/dehydratase family protein n=1 Tax=Treponema pectinovorum TaxID=164 RepID=UPI0011CA94A3|nr:NAD-dependent epimerase/dehydratase family protein [Treponema pectinovorum]